MNDWQPYPHPVELKSARGSKTPPEGLYRKLEPFVGTGGTDALRAVVTAAGLGAAFPESSTAESLLQLLAKEPDVTSVIGAALALKKHGYIRTVDTVPLHTVATTVSKRGPVVVGSPAGVVIVDGVLDGKPYVGNYEFEITENQERIVLA